jgi:hypothetical protein
MRYPNIVVAAARPRIVVGGFTRTKVTRLPYIDPDSPEYKDRPPGNMGRAKDPFGQARVWLTDREADSLAIEHCYCSRATGVYRRQR